MDCNISTRKNIIYIYDSFARNNILNKFIKTMKHQDINIYFVNKKTDQNPEQLNCGIRSIIWLFFVYKYGLNDSMKI